MLPFIASLATILIASPKAKSALRNLAVEGTILSLDLKEQIEAATGLRKQMDKSTSSGNHASLSHMFAMEEETPDSVLQEFERTYAVMDTDALKQRLPKP